MNSKSVFSVITTISLIIANIFHILFTILIIIEEIQTGIGYTTNLEILVILPWIIEIVICLPVIVLAIVSFCVSSKNNIKRINIINISLFTFLLLQLIIFNIFIWY